MYCKGGFYLCWGGWLMYYKGDYVEGVSDQLQLE